MATLAWPQDELEGLPGLRKAIKGHIIREGLLWGSVHDESLDEGTEEGWDVCCPLPPGLAVDIYRDPNLVKEKGHESLNVRLVRNK